MRRRARTVYAPHAVHGVQPPVEAVASLLYVPAPQASQDPSLVHVSVEMVSSAAGQSQPERYLPASHPLSAHGVWLCGWCVCG